MAQKMSHLLTLFIISGRVLVSSKTTDPLERRYVQHREVLKG